MKSRDLTKESWRSLLSELVANQETVGQFKASGANPASFQPIRSNVGVANRRAPEGAGYESARPVLTLGLLKPGASG